MSGPWVALNAEALKHYFDGEFLPLHVREVSPDVIEVRTEHMFPTNRALQRRCQRCGLLPLEYDALEYTCERRFSVRDDYEPKFGRQHLSLWSGGFASDYEGVAIELPGHNGYMIELEYVAGKIRVECPSPRTDDNFVEVDAAIARAANEHENTARMAA